FSLVTYRFLLSLPHNYKTFFSIVQIISIKMSAIGKNIRKIRTIKGLSQSDFANFFGLTRASISAYEENRAEPKIDIALQIAKHFNIPIQKLITQELTVNEYAKFNLQKFIPDKSILETISILIVSSRNWD